MRWNKDREGHAGRGFAAGVLVNTLHAAVRSIHGNSFECHDFTAPAPLRRQNGNNPKMAASTSGLVLAHGRAIQAALGLDFATWVAIASISAGDRQSYGSSPSSLRRDLIPLISDGLTPDSITEDTNAANPGAAEPLSMKSSGWMKSRP